MVILVFGPGQLSGQTLFIHIAFTPQEMADLKKALEILSSEIKDVATQLPC
ncbi:MAG: hypothetical protein NC410_05330 [Oscillibacter sp.]|nr:hypothetical protein [Oscillibacter sp.]